MSASSHTDPAERHPFLRFFYRDWRPTRAGHLVNRSQAWLTNLGLMPKTMAVLEVRGRTSGKPRTLPIAIARLEGKAYLVSMLGPESDWVKNVEAADGRAVVRHGKSRREVCLVRVPVEERAPILKEYVRIAQSGRNHFPVAVDAPLAEYEAIAERYPAYRITRMES